ncbi:MAG: precorrin-3B synthase, partial [Paracoccaceae bacterium]
MSAPEVKGWCPGALRPMESGDGWLVRIRPPGGMLSPTQARGIAEASLRHGNGVLDLSSRANLQLRGVRIERHAALVDDLRALGVVDADAGTEQARNVTITPFWQAGDGTLELAERVTQAMMQMQGLPGKFGAVVDTGPHPALTEVPGDIRLERDAAGGLILRPDGHGFGQAVTAQTVPKAALTLLKWFLATGGAPLGRGRMAAHVARMALPEGFTVAPAQPLPRPVPGMHAAGVLVALAFGQMRAETLVALAD